MRNISILLLLTLLAFPVSGQDLPTIVPPSPNAAALHVYGNTQTNSYTGAIDLTVPIWEIKEGELTLPIYLKYTGGNGLKVEEMASWIGLGWSLNAGGAISRVIRGIPDEDDSSKEGYFTLTDIPAPSINNQNLFLRMANGNADGEPDKFMYNYPNGSGSFFHDFDQNVFLKPKKDIKITHTIGVESESISVPHCETYDNVITDFTLTDEYGNTYFFKDKERSNTINLGVPYTDNRGFPSTWYLRKMENRLKTRSIDFEYDTYGYILKRRMSVIKQPTSSESDQFSETSYIGKRLKKIYFSNGYIEFVPSTDNREDLENDKYLDQVIVKDNYGQVIKVIKFTYQYMTPNGMVGSDTNIALGESCRLMLTSVQECDGNDTCKPATTFLYETSNFLPSRFSKAQDHWGYYNGQNGNTSLEPKHIVTWYNPFNPSPDKIEHQQFGSANRAPDFNYSTAGILREVQYPSGGRTAFEYESHTADHDKIVGTLTNRSVGMFWMNQLSQPFTIDSGTSALTEIEANGFYQDPVTQCQPIVHIRNTVTNQVETLQLSEKKLFADGTYEAWFELESNVVGTCTQDDPASVTLKWTEEGNSLTKTIGGVRVASILDYPSGSTLATKRNFDYTGDNGVTSGRLVVAPQYSRISGEYTSLSPLVWSPISYVRYTNSYLPLVTTQGSNVGYGKVTISHENNGNGKEEHYFTTAEQYPDPISSVDPDNTGLAGRVLGGITFYAYPFPEIDSKDYLRGALKKSIIYKNDGATYTKIHEKLHFYDSLNYSKGDPPSIDNYIENAASTVRGIKVNSDNGAIDYTYYNIYTGYNLPSKTIEKHYNDSGTLTQISEMEYDKDFYGTINHYTPIGTLHTNSDGDTLESKTIFPFNKSSRTGAEQDLVDKNGLYVPLRTDTYENNTRLSSQYTVYNDQKWQYLNVPEYIQVSKGTGILENRIVYKDYDDFGNPLQVSRANGSNISYIWGYNGEYPIAKIENLGSGDIDSALQALITAAEAASDADDDRTVDTLSNGVTGHVGNEGALRGALEDLRGALPYDALMRSYTYDPLIGVTSITDPRGYTTYYEYDGLNRLRYVRDAEGNLISENGYHYKNQQ